MSNSEFMARFLKVWMVSQKAPISFPFFNYEGVTDALCLLNFKSVHRRYYLPRTQNLPPQSRKSSHARDRRLRNTQRNDLAR